MTDALPSTNVPLPETSWAWFFDIDGTLASIAASPDAVTIDPAITNILDILHAQTLGAVALISGRSLRDIDKLFPHHSFAAAGQHGAEVRHGSGMVERREGGAHLDWMRASLREMEQRHTGLFLEDKGLSLALHYRQVPRLEPFVLREVRALFMKMPAGFLMQTGKCVVEIVPIGNTKGTVVSEFMSEYPFRGRIPVFVGDDVTDETAFAVINAMGGLSIKVGAGPTQARYRLIDVKAVHQWLMHISSFNSEQHSRAGGKT